MEVSSINGLDTHAVIGGEKAHAFEISQSAEFFTVLSSTLYRDKMLAVIREVVCNAWDAHIASGQTDRPIEIKITNSELVIKDFGPGIPHDKIGAIYCRYGASTKTADGSQTGGFGLGSKAPFAYSDHFSVTSCHNGVRSVYAISRGGAETAGKPDFRRMVNVPAEESGVTVSIPIREEEDCKKFIRIAVDVIVEGGMKAMINDKAVSGPDYNHAREQGFGLFRTTKRLESPVYVLYGTVMYPVAFSSDNDLYAGIVPLTKFVSSGGEEAIVLFAPANSIGVTPSRESLSLTELTKSTLIRLVKRATNLIDQSVKKNSALLYEACFTGSKKSWRTVPASEIKQFAYRHKIKISDGDHTNQELIRSVFSSDLDQIGKHVFSNNPYNRNHSAASKKAFMRSLKKKPGQKDYLSHVRRALKNVHHDHYGSDMHLANLKFDSRLFLRIASKVGLLSQMFVGYGAYYSDGLSDFMPIEEASTIRRKFNVKNTLHVAFSQRELKLAMKEKIQSINVGMRSETLFIGIVLRKNQIDKITEITTLGAKYKLNVVSSSIPATKKSASTVKTYYSLKDNFGPAGRNKKEPTLVKPKYYVMGERDGTAPSLPYWFSGLAADAMNTFEDVAVIYNKNQEIALKKLGAKDLCRDIVDTILANKDDKSVQFSMIRHFGHSVFDYGRRTDVSRFIAKMTMVNPIGLSKLLDLNIKFSPESELAFKFGFLVANVRYWVTDPTERRKLSDEAGEFSRLCDKTLAPIGADLKSGKYTWMKGISVINLHFEDEEFQTVMDFCAFLKRRHQRVEKRSMSNTPSIITESEKEVA